MMDIKGNLNEIIPSNLKKNEDIKRFIEILDNEISLIDNQINNLLVFKKLADDTLEEQYVDKLANMFHILPNESYRFADTVQRKRNLVKNSLDLHRTKGTKYAVERVLELLGFNGKIKEWFEEDYSDKGIGKPYYFKIKSEAFDGMSPANISLLKEMIGEFKNVRSHLDIIEFETVARGKFYYSGANLIHNNIECLPYFNDEVGMKTNIDLLVGTYLHSEIEVKEQWVDQVDYNTHINIAAIPSIYNEINVKER